MSFSDWLTSLSAGSVALSLGVTAFFAQKWIASVEDSIKENSNKILSLSNSIKIDSKKTNHLVESEGLKIVNSLKNIEGDLCTVFEQVASLTDNISKISEIEKRIADQEIKLIKLFEVAQKLLLKAQK